MERIRSALFLDFDNIFSGLIQLDRRAAYVLVDELGRWLNALATRALPTDARRDFLVRRAYLNPAGKIPDAERGNESGLLYFQKFRPNLTQSGFEVVDCPALTPGQKNAADIRIVIDILQSLDANTRYDEFIVASSDADFTPLLQRLRADDRRTMIISAGEAAPAYRSIADVFLDATALVDLLVDEDWPGKEANLPSAAMPDGQWAQVRDQALQAARKYIEGSDGPALLAELGLKLRSEFNDAIEQTNWFGARSLSAFVHLANSDFRTKGHYVWNPDKHPEPEDEEANPLPDSLPESVAQICRITDLPRLSTADWKATFEGIARYANTHEFNLTECTAWTRDHLAEMGIRVGRSAVGFIVRGAKFGDVRLDSRPAPSADDIRDALLQSIIARAQALTLNLTDDDESDLRDWLRGEGTAGEVAG